MQVVAAVVKNTDNLVKGFATSVSIILSCFLSSLFFKDFKLSASFLLGALVVVLSTFTYGYNFNNSSAEKKKV